MLETLRLDGKVAAVKGRALSLTRALGVEWARRNVEVDAVAPGWFVTDTNAAAFDQAGTPRPAAPGRPGPACRRVQEIGPVAVCLASAASDFMTGQALFLDGGLFAA